MNKNAQVHKSAIQVFEETLEAERVRLNKEFMESIHTRMEELNMSQADMAYTLGKSRAYISKLFAQNQNLTIKTMVELATTLEVSLALKIRPKRALAAGKWVDDQYSWFGTMALRCVGNRVSSVAKHAPWNAPTAHEGLVPDDELAVAG